MPISDMKNRSLQNVA